MGPTILGSLKSLNLQCSLASRVLRDLLVVFLEITGVHKNDYVVAESVCHLTCQSVGHTH